MACFWLVFHQHHNPRGAWGKALSPAPTSFGQHQGLLFFFFFNISSCNDIKTPGKQKQKQNKAKQNLAQNSRNAAPSILPLQGKTLPPPQTWGESAVLSHNHVPSSNSHCAENRHKSLSCVSSTLPKFFGIRASWSVAQRRGLSSSDGRKPA